MRRGERAGVDNDQGVFNIQVGTAITLAVADGSKADGALAEITYLDSWNEGLFRRGAKLGWLRGGAEAGALPNSVAVERSLLEDMRPQPFQNREWLDLREIFVFSKSGMKSGNDPVFISPSQNDLREKVSEFLAARGNTAYDQSLEIYYCYRPLDRRWFYNDLRLLNRPGPELQDAWGADNVGIYAMPSGTNAGPGLWCHGLLPDYHAFRGSYGGYAFPLYDRRPDVNAPNISPGLLRSLSRAYGEAVAAEDVFDAILCLLSATSYSLRFAEDLEDVFPHVPFPGRPEVFREAVRTGREIRAVETFAREPGEAFGGADFVRVETEPRGLVAEVEFDGGEIVLCDDESGRIMGIPQAVWEFSVSGYRIVPRWLNGRVGLTADFALVQEFRDICSRIAELIALFEQADAVLEAALQETLSREALGFANEGQEANDG